MIRLRALEEALASLPPPEERVAFWPRAAAQNDGTITWNHPDYYQSIRDFFTAFEAGRFGFAVGDRKYLECLEAWQTCIGKNPFEPDAAHALDREACLLVLRCVNRQERFADGSWEAAHGAGILHAVVGRLIELERAERM